LNSEHLDDIFGHDLGWLVLVAIMVMCVDWIFHVQRAILNSIPALTILSAASFICLTGRIGATYHISFPVVARASFGIWGSLWPVFNRAAMACIWYGVQAWIGGNEIPPIPESVLR
jgi:cytosine/uracil/thiamine/allantoin permease